MPGVRCIGIGYANRRLAIVSDTASAGTQQAALGAAHADCARRANSCRKSRFSLCMTGLLLYLLNKFILENNFYIPPNSRSSHVPNHLIFNLFKLAVRPNVIEDFFNHHARVG